MAPFVKGEGEREVGPPIPLRFSTRTEAQEVKASVAHDPGETFRGQDGE